MQRDSALDSQTAASTLDVLVVDDDPELADLVATHLERVADGLSVATATDPRTGLEMARRGRYDCVVSDYHMPGMDGTSLLDRVAGAAPSTARVLLSSDDGPAVRRAARETGVPYVRKRLGPEWYERLASDVRAAVRAGGD